MKTRRRISCVLLMVCLLLTLFPISALAESDHGTIRQNVMAILYGGKSGGSLLADFALTGTNYSGWHQGIDFRLTEGVPVYAIAEGVVTRVTDPTAEEMQLSTIAIYNSRCNLTVVYLHTKNAKNYIKEGQTIQQGQQIAQEGKKGNGVKITPHTHVEIRKGKQTSAAVSRGATSQANPDPYPLLEELLAVTNTGTQEYRQNISTSHVTVNATRGSLPADATIYAGNSYYFNLQTVETVHLTKAELYVKLPGESSFSKKWTETPGSGASYFTYAYPDNKISVGIKSGTLQYYWRVSNTNGQIAQSTTKSVTVNPSSTSTGTQEYRQNISASHVTSNATKGSLPEDATIYAGNSYYFNLQTLENIHLTKAELYVKLPGESNFSKKWTETPGSGASYFTYVYSDKINVGNKNGILQYYWRVSNTNNQTAQSTTESVMVAPLNTGTSASTDENVFVIISTTSSQGDINGDSEVDIFDLVNLQQIILGISNPAAGQNVDINGDGEVDIFDLVALQHIILAGN